MVWFVFNATWIVLGIVLVDFAVVYGALWVLFWFDYGWLLMFILFPCGLLVRFVVLVIGLVWLVRSGFASIRLLVIVLFLFGPFCLVFGWCVFVL